MEYVLSRHNVGFQVIDLYRTVQRVKTKARIQHTSLIYRTYDLLLVKPLTHMNQSGCAVQSVLNAAGIDVEDAVVVFDDLDLPLGTMRLLPGGGPGTHNGMKSVIAKLGTENVPRLRVGIAPEDQPSDAADFVLGHFGIEEWRAILPVLRRAVDAAETFRREGLEAAMNRYNRRTRPIAHGAATAIIETEEDEPPFLRRQ